MTTEIWPTLYYCEDCMGCDSDTECEGNGFLDDSKGDVTCPCCGDLVAVSE